MGFTYDIAKLNDRRLGLEFCQEGAVRQLPGGSGIKGGRGLPTSAAGQRYVGARQSGSPYPLAAHAHAANSEPGVWSKTAGTHAAHADGWDFAWQPR